MGLRPSFLIALIVTSAACGREGELLALHDVAEIVCGRSGSTELSDREVSASADGVHVRVQNEADGYVFISGLGIGVDEGTTENASTTPPGVVEIACRPHSLEDGPEPKRVSLRINDPRGYWVDYEVSCMQFRGSSHGSGVSSSIFHPSGPTAAPLGEPETLGRHDFSGLVQADEVERAGYPQAASGAFARVVRKGETIASAMFERSGRRWFATSIRACVGAGLGLRL